MNPTGFKAVCRFDPALDSDRMRDEGTLMDFTETGDYSKVRLLEGEKAAVFHCRRLKVSEMQAAKTRTDEASVFVACFTYGVTRVDDLRSEDGTRRVWVRPDTDRRITTREIDEVFDAGEVFEIGALIFGRSILGKGRPAAWPQPDTSLAAVAALGFHLRRVEQTRQRDASSAPSSPPPEAPPSATESD